MASLQLKGCDYCIILATQQTEQSRRGGGKGADVTALPQDGFECFKKRLHIVYIYKTYRVLNRYFYMGIQFCQRRFKMQIHLKGNDHSTQTIIF